MSSLRVQPGQHVRVFGACEPPPSSFSIPCYFLGGNWLPISLALMSNALCDSSVRFTQIREHLQVQRMRDHDNLRVLERNVDGIAPADSSS
jgi:hypothetical protein